MGSFFNNVNSKQQSGNSNQESFKTKNSKLNQNSKLKTRNYLSSALVFLRLKALELRYLPHLEIRLVHDKNYAKGGKYKQWTDNPKSEHIHRTTAYAFMFSFVIFTLAQALFPIFNLGNPSPALAGSDTVTWTTTSHFNNNGASGSGYQGQPIINGIDTSGDKLSIINEVNQEVIETGLSSNINRIFDYDGNLKFAVGNGGAIFKTIDGGLSWSQLSSGTSADLHSVIFTSQSNGVIGASNNTILRTSDGGTNWSIATGPSSSGTFIYYGFAFPTTSTGYVIGSSGGSSAAVYKTTNGGSSWSLSKSLGSNLYGVTYRAIACFDTNNCVASGGALGDVFILRNGVWGSSAIRTQSGTSSARYNDFYIVDSTTIYGITTGGSSSYFKKSINKGDTWSDIKFMSGFSSVESLKCVNQDLCAITNTAGTIGSGLFFSENTSSTSQSWSNLSLNRLLRDVKIYSKNLFTAVGDGGYIANIRTGYSLSANASNYRIDNGSNFNSTWNQISWSGDKPTDTNIKFRTRGSNVDDPTSMTGDASTGWTYWNEDSEGNSYYTISGTSIVTPKTRWLEVEVTLETNNPDVTPTVNDFTVTSTLQAPSESSLFQNKSDDSGSISAGGWHNSGVNLSVENTSGFENATSFYGEFEVKPVGSVFDGTGVSNGSTVAPGETTEVTINKEPGNYKWRVRLYDSAGRVSPWTEFNSGNSAFQIDQSPPTGTVTINAGAEYATSTSVTLTLSATDTGGSSTAKTNLQYRLSNSGNENEWTDWTAYPANDTVSNWDLTLYGGNADDGTKNVYVQYRDSAGNVNGEFQTSQADFDTGTYNASEIGTNDGEIKLIGPAGGGFTDTAYLTSELTFTASTPSASFLRLCASDYYPDTFPVYAKVGNGTQVLFDIFGDYAYGNSIVTKILTIPNGEATTISVDGGCGYNSVFTLPSGYKFIGSSLELTLSLSFFDNSYDEVVNLDFGADTKAVGTIAATLPITSTYTSKVFGTDEPKAYEKINWNSLENGGSSLSLQFRAGDTATPDGMWTSWSGNLIKGQSLNSYNGKKHFQYRAILSSGTNQTVSPLLYDVSIINGVGDSITLDTKAPANVTNLKSFAGQGGAELNHEAWGQTNNPYFTWDAVTTNIQGGAENVAGYKYCFSTDQNCTPTTEISNTNFQASITNQGMHYFKVVAYDFAGNNSPTPTVFKVGFDNQIPGAPGSLTLSTNIIEYINVTWQAPPGDTGSPFTNYQLERVRKKDYDDYQLTSSGDWSQVGGEPVPGFTVVECGNLLTYREYPSGPQGNNCSIVNGGENITASVAYYFRVRARDLAHPGDWGSWYYSGSPGLTRDGTPPTVPTDVSAVPNGDYAVTITWGESYDEGVGVARYDIYRSRSDSTNPEDYEIIGYVENVIPYSRIWYDNDQKNDEFDGEIKLVASSRLVDSANYYYRIVAVDGADNQTDIIPAIHPFTNPDGFINRATVQTDDATPPTISELTSAITSDITEIEVNWEPWADVSGRDATVTGSGVASYEVWRRTGATWYQVTDGDGNNANNQFIDRNHDSYDLYAEFSTLSGGITAQNPANGGSISLVDASSYPDSGRILIDGEYIDYTSKNGNTLEGITRGVIASTITEHTDGVTVYVIDRFQSLTTYYYKIRATDNTGNVSGFTTEDPNYEGAKTRTPDATAPSAPRNVNVTSYKEAPNLNGAEDDESNNYKIKNYGQMMTITWNGSQDNSKVLGYELYRSETIPTGLSAAAWLASATKLATVNLSGATSSDERSVSYTYIDNNESNSQTAPLVQKIGGAANATVTKAVTPNLVDAKVYYYRVMAFDDAEPEVLYSSLSAPSTPTTRASDYTPDSTPPATPDEVKINPIWGVSENDFRFVITWKRIEDSLRNGQPDFRSYRLYRSTDGEIFEQVTINGQNPLLKEDRSVSIEQNYFVDSDVSQNLTYYYYVTSVDDAGANFRYPDPPYTGAPIISAHNNESVKSVTVSQNPTEVAPEILALDDNNLKARVLSTGVSTATVYWKTNQPTESLVEYRKKGTNDPFFGTYNSDMVVEHTLTIKGLDPATEYEYRVSGKNIVGFDKKAGAGTTDNNVQPLATKNFRITDVRVTQTTTESATIEWRTTDIDSDSSVQYIECDTNDPNSCSNSRGAFNTEMVRNHKVILDSLKPATRYIYKVRSTTADGNVAEISSFQSFRTQSFDSAQFTISPSASDIAQENITATSAKIVWNTAIPTTTWVDYGTRPSAYNQSAGDDKLNTVHVVDLRNLTPGTTYYYRVRGKDANGIQYLSREYSFTAVLQPEIRNLRFNLNSSYTAEVTFDTNVDTEASVTFGKDNNLDLKAGSAELKRNHLIKLENLEDASNYRYFVEVRDSLGNVKRSETQPFSTPLDKTGPKVLNLKIDILPMSESDETASVIISWNTDKPSTTKVEYDEGVIGGKMGKSTIEDDSLNTSHTVIIKDLTPSTTYRFKIAGKDRRENITDSNEYTFVTPAQEKSIFQLIVRSLEETFAWTKNLGSFFSNLRQKAR